MLAIRRASSPLLLSMLLVAPPATAAAQAPAGAPEPSARVEVLILGTYHFGNPGLDIVKNEVADVLAPAKQEEIARIVDALARFRPTKVALEVRTEHGARIDSLYRAYRGGRHALGRSESQQLGFRLAERFGHETVYAVDHDGEFPFGPVMAYAARHDPALAERIQRTLAAVAGEMGRMQREWTIGQILRHENDPARIAWTHGSYMGLNGVGAGDGYPGAELLAGWYERNLRIHANVQRIAAPGDRILVIYGTAHLGTLREFARSTPGWTLVEAADFLPPR